MIRLRTLGECLIELHGTALGPESDVLFTVLLYLTAERDRRLSRAAVAELFWPELPPRRARHCLRQVLYRLRALGLHVQTAHEHLLLAGEHVTPSFAATPTSERFDLERRAGTLVLGPLLAGCVPKGSPAFHDWFEAHRGHVHFHVRRVLLEKAREHRLRGEWSDVEWLARECLRLDPLNEEATLTLAESMVMVGGKAEAIAYLDRYLAEIGGDASNARLPATILRRRIAERFPSRRYAGPRDRCFVGRADLLATVATALLRARNGDGGAVLLWGPPGIGKSRLATEVAKIADVEGMRIVRVQCEESAAGRPLAVFMEAMPELLAYSGAIGCAPSSLAYLRRLMQLDPSASAIDALDATTLAANIRRAVVDLVDAVSEEVPLLLVVDDAQWADPASWAVLRALVEWSTGKPVLFLFTSRTPHATPRRPERTATRLELHELPPLDDASAAELVRNVADAAGRAVSAEALAWCIEAGEGNPLFIQELAGHWIETEQTRGTPPSLQALLEGRLARLSPEAKRVMQAVVVLGSYATTERIGEVLGLQPYALIGAVDELASERLVVEQSHCLAPRHERLAQAAIESVAEPARRALHRRMAVLLERELEDRGTPETLLQCVEEWRRGDREDRAYAAVIAKAPLLIRRHPPPSVLSVVDRALALTSSLDLRVQALRVRALCAIANAESAKVQVLRVASDVIPGLPNQAANDRIEYVAELWRLTLAGHELLGELTTLALDPKLDVRTRLKAISLGLAISDNDNCAAEATRFAAILAATRPENDPDRIAAYRAAMIYHCGFGDPQMGLAAAEAISQHLPHRPQGHTELKLLLHVAEAHRALGDGRNAVPLLRRAYHWSVEFGEARIAFDTADKLATTLLDLGDTHAAQRWFGLARRATPEAHGLDFFGRLVTQSRLCLGAADVDGARDLIFAMAAFQPAHVNWRSRRHFVTLRAELQLAADEHPPSSAELEELVHIHSRLSRTSMHDRTALVAARSLARGGYKKEAHSLLSAYVNEERRGGALSLELREELERIRY